MMTGLRAAIFVLGISGSGKSTAAKVLVENLGFRLISGGKMIRELASANEVALGAISKGEGIPDYLVIELYSSALRIAKGSSVVFDGNPKDHAQFVKTIDLINRFGYSLGSTCCIHLQLSPEAALERLYFRRICPTCGFQGTSDACVVCGSQTIRRYDDSRLQVLDAKFTWFRHDVLPAIQWFATKGTVLSIDANQDLEKVRGDILSRSAEFLSRIKIT